MACSSRGEVCSSRDARGLVIINPFKKVSTCTMTTGEPEATEIVKQVMTQGHSLFYHKRIVWNAEGDRFSDVIHFPEQDYAIMLNDNLNFIGILYRCGLVGSKTGKGIDLSWGCTGVFSLPICMDEMKVIAKPIPPVAATIRNLDYKMLYEDLLKQNEETLRVLGISKLRIDELERQLKQSITALSNRDHQIRILEDIKKDTTPDEQKLVDMDGLFHHVDNVRHFYELVGKTVPHWYVKVYGHFFGYPGNDKFRNIGGTVYLGADYTITGQPTKFVDPKDFTIMKRDILPFGKPSQFEIVECDDDNEFPTIIKPKNEEEAKVLYAPRNITGIERGCEGGSCGG